MACTVKELRVFLAGLDGDDVIGVDVEGLTLIVPAKNTDDPKKCERFDNGEGIVLVSNYFEIGGIPIELNEEEEEDDPFSASDDPSDPLRCRYEDCRHPVVSEDEQVTCPECRADLGLPPLD